MPTSSPPSSSGFTLIEMLVVLTIVGLLAAAATATLGRQEGVARRGQAAALRLAIEKARQTARTTGRPQTVDPAVSLPGAQLADGLPEHPGAPAAATLRFYPDGSSSGGRVMVGARAVLSVDWLTGSVRHGA